jgi:beta-lactamase class A
VDTVEKVFAEVGAEACLHAVDVDSGREVALRPDEPVVLASIVKVLIVLEFARQAATGALDPAERVTVRRADRLGGWGVAGCADDVEISLRDLAFFAMSVSDNTAADLLLRRVGPDVVPLLAADLGLAATVVRGGPRQTLESMLEDVGARDDAEFARLFPTLGADRVRALRAYDPARATASTPRDVTRLLGLLWRDEAGPPAACRTVRDLMGRQLVRNRVASGFGPQVRVSAKTGTLPGLHMEAAVVEPPGGGRYAGAAFARTAGLVPFRHDVDLAIGRAARTAVDTLRELR